MSYRNDASALLARVNALERELESARRQIAALRREAGHAVDDGPIDLDDIEIRADDLELARQTLAGLLDEPHGGGRREVDPEVREAPERDAATEQLVVLRRALLALLDRKLGGAVPAELIARIDACPTAAQLIDWIGAVGAARGRKKIATIISGS